MNVKEYVPFSAAIVGGDLKFGSGGVVPWRGKTLCGTIVLLSHVTVVPALIVMNGGSKSNPDEFVATFAISIVTDVCAVKSLN